MKSKICSLILVILTLTMAGCGIKQVDYGDEYVFEQDNQTFNVGSKNAVYTNNGYYVVNSDSTMLYFVDTLSNKAKPLCIKPDCKHNQELDGEDCNAYFFAIHGINYYDNNIYVSAGELNEKNEFVERLYRISLDGSEREPIVDLYQADNGDFLEEDNVTNAESFIIHRGMGYLTINWNTQTQKEIDQTIYKVPLNGDSIEELVTYKGINPQITFLYTRGNRIYYGLSTRNNETREWEKRYFYIDILTDKISEVLLPDNHVFVSNSDNKNISMNYNDDGSVSVYQSTGKEDMVNLASVDYEPLVFRDYKYLYFDNSFDMTDKHIVNIMDYKGKINSVVEVDGSLMCSDTRNILTYDSETGAYNLYDINTGQKKEIDTEKIETEFNPAQEDIRKITN